MFKKMIIFRCFVYLLVLMITLMFQSANAMTRQQLKNSGKLMKKTCMPKHDVTEGNGIIRFVRTEEQVGDIEKGKFIEDRNVMCYMACVYGMMQVVKNGKLSPEAVMKAVDLMFPADMKDAVKAAAENCKEHAKKKDVCEASYFASKCMYDYDPKNFFFP